MDNLKVGETVEVVFDFGTRHEIKRQVKIIHEGELGYFSGVVNVFDEPALVEVWNGVNENRGSIVGYINELNKVLGINALLEALSEISNYKYKESPENSPLGAAHVDFAEAAIDMKRIANKALNNFS